MLPSVKILLPWWGKLPVHFPFWLHSCEANPAFQWLIISDSKPDIPFPDNVFFLKMDLGTVAQRIRERIGIAPPSLSPYKLCDFRPAFGIIFQEEIGDAVFWGHSEIDLIYGNLSTFLTPEVVGHFVVSSG